MQQHANKKVSEKTHFVPSNMRFCKALFLASLPKIIANPLVPDRTANLADNPDLTANPADDLALTANPADNPDLVISQVWNALPQADSNFFAATDTASSGLSGSGENFLDTFNPVNQNGLNIGLIPSSIAAVNTDISKSECSSSISHSSKTLRTREQGQQYFPVGDCADAVAREIQAQKDAEDAAWAEAYLEAHPDEDVDKKAEFVCKRIPDYRILPLCCRGPQISIGDKPFVTLVLQNCVAFIEGRPRCMGFRNRFCCWVLGYGFFFQNSGVDCRTMYEQVA